MSVYSTTCPHCHTENVSFESVAAKQHKKVKELFTTFYICKHCEKGIMLLMHCLTTPNPHDYPGDIIEYEYCQILEIKPDIQPIDMPNYLPERIQKLFKQAAINSQRLEFEESVGMICRKILEKSLSLLAPETNGLKLFHRIENALKNN